MLKEDRWAVVFSLLLFSPFSCSLPLLLLFFFFVPNWLYIKLASPNLSCPFQCWSSSPLPPPQGLPLSQQPQWTHGALLLLSHPWRAVIPGHPTPLLPLIPGALQLPVLRPPTQVTIGENEFEFDHERLLFKGNENDISSMAGWCLEKVNSSVTSACFHLPFLSFLF